MIPIEITEAIVSVKFHIKFLFLSCKYDKYIYILKEMQVQRKIPIPAQ